MLIAKAKERTAHPGLVPHPLGSPYGPVCAWHANEMKMLLDDVNRLRVEQGSETITMAQIVQAEIAASGHSDYARNLAISCAQFVVLKPRVVA
jgi:hypothetical protein